MTDTGLYIPPGCETLDKAKTDPQIRLGLQGMPGCGKTWLALTFPNPIVANFDRGLIGHRGRSDVIEVPFYDGKFVDSIVKRDGLQGPPNRKDALSIWLSKEATKLSAQQTLVLDSNKQIQNEYHVWYKMNPVISKSGKENDFAEWNLKINYFNDLGTSLKELKCNVIYICHETPDRDKEGNLTGMNRPLVSGQIGDAIASDYTDWYRVIAVAKPADEEMATRFKKKFMVNDSQLLEWKKSTPNDTIYMCQTQSDDICKCKTSLVNVPKFILASHESISKYMRKVI